MLGQCKKHWPNTKSSPIAIYCTKYFVAHSKLSVQTRPVYMLYAVLTFDIILQPVPFKYSFCESIWVHRCMTHNLFHNLNLFKLILYAGAIHPMSSHIPTIGAVFGSPRKYLIALLNTLMCSIYTLYLSTQLMNIPKLV